jgi:hypothetical protein
MKYILAVILIAALVSALPATVYAEGEVSEDGTAGMSFLRIDPSAVISSMGGQGSALDTGASSTWSNPALIALHDSRTVQFTHISWVEGINQEYAAITTPSELGHFGFTFQLFDSGDIDLYGNTPSDSPLGSYSITNAALSFVYARHITEWVTVGAAYKQLIEKNSDETASGYAVDAGITVAPNVEGLMLAATLRNYGRMGVLKSERPELPSDVVIGASYRFILPSVERPVRLCGDYLFPRYGDSGIRAGMDIEPVDRFFIRMGYRSDSDIQSLSYGVGIHMNMFMFDVSYTPMQEGFDNALRFTLGISGF